MPHPLYEGNLINAVISSCCVPGIYIPPYTEDKILVDGGLTENVPISLLRKFGVQKTVAINLNGQTKYTRPKNVMSVVANSLDIAIDHITKNQLKEADLVFNLDLSSYNRFVIEKVDEIIDYSYQQCIEKFH
jgi:NTE family protein